MKFLIRTLAFLVIIQLNAAPAYATDDPRDWLMRMNKALTSLNYSGVFFYFNEGRAESMKIIHRVADGRTVERLVSLDGAGREIIRDQDEVTCIFPDKRSVLIGQRRDKGTLIGAVPQYSSRLDLYYEFVPMRRERLIGKMTRVISVVPRDGFRYGYELWLDEETALPLMSKLKGDNGNVIEQVRFASISVDGVIKDSDLKPAIDTTGFTVYRTGNKQPVKRQPGTGWRAGDLPAGFELTASNTEEIANSNGPVDHLVYSDGLASVSVFVEAIEGDKPMQGLSRIGSANAWSTEFEGFQITAVGEVPAVTVEAIGVSVKPQTRDARR